MNIVKRESTSMMQFDTFENAMKWAEMIASSSLCPPEFIGKPGNVLIAIQYGQELGLKPMQSLQGVYVVKGKPTVYGDTLLAVCMSAPDFEYCQETFDEETWTATCKVKRKNRPERIKTFTQKDAETAGLWGRQGPWRTHPKRMTEMKARGFALRDEFADILSGFSTYEEMSEIVEEKVINSTPSNNISYINYKDRFKQIATEQDIKLVLEHLKVTSYEEVSESDAEALYHKLCEKRKVA